MTLALLLLGALAALPIISTQYLPLLDYPNHMARMHVLLEAGRSALLDQFYLVHWRPLPDLAVDLVVPILAQVMPLDWAGRAFILLTMALMVGGTVAVHRALFREGEDRSPIWWPFLSLLFLYDHILLMGFLNYLFGVGLALVGFAAWLGVRDRSVGARIAVGTGSAVVIYFAHLFAFGLYGLLVAGYELQQASRLWRQRDLSALRPLLVAAAQFVVPAILLGLYVLILRDHAEQGGGQGGLGFGKLIRKFDLVFSVFDNYQRAFDIVCFLGVVLAFVIALWRGLIRIVPTMSLPLLLLGVAHFAMPTSVVTAFAVDRRMPIAFALLLIASSRPARWRPRVELAVAGALALLFVVRISLIEVNWQKADRIYAGWAAVLDQMPRGAKLALAYSPDALRMVPKTVPIAHFPLIEVARHDVFVQSLFALETQQPVALSPTVSQLAGYTRPETLWSAFVEQSGPVNQGLIDELRRYDYVLFISHTPFHVRDNEAYEPQHLEPTFQLFKLHSLR